MARTAISLANSPLRWPPMPSAMANRPKGNASAPPKEAFMHSTASSLLSRRWPGSRALPAMRWPYLLDPRPSLKSQTCSSSSGAVAALLVIGAVLLGARRNQRLRKCLLGQEPFGEKRVHLFVSAPDKKIYAFLA